MEIMMYRTINENIDIPSLCKCYNRDYDTKNDKPVPSTNKSCPICHGKGYYMTKLPLMRISKQAIGLEVAHPSPHYIGLRQPHESHLPKGRTVAFVPKNRATFLHSDQLYRHLFYTEDDAEIACSKVNTYACQQIESILSNYDLTVLHAINDLENNQDIQDMLKAYRCNELPLMRKE